MSTFPTKTPRKSVATNMKKMMNHEGGGVRFIWNEKSLRGYVGGQTPLNDFFSVKIIEGVWGGSRKQNKKSLRGYGVGSKVGGTVSRQHIKME